ncbi:NAD-dependent epimerase/dehydratase family protein [Streptococcus alactolyticus]|uniref:NAD-dependent epimerase/dehydratase family protein n=1 Tax=Streptococcus alactolyticus TaxID=29389 RepID=UPI003F9752C7
MKKIIVFGATGNIGAYLVDYLNSKLNSNEYKVIAVGRKKTSFFEKIGVQYLRVDVNKSEDFEKLPTDDVFAIVNLAGLLPAYLKEYNPYKYVETNIMGALRILEFARRNKVDRVLYTQTWSVQGGYWGKKEVLSPKDPKSLIYTGDHAFYCITKCMIEETMEHYKQEYGVKNFVFRLPNVYLYHPEKTYFVDGIERKIGYRYMIDLASRGKNIELWGDPNAFKDILYIKDLCQLMYKAILTNVNGGTYNAGTGIKTTLQEQIEGMINVFNPEGEKSEIIYKPDRSGFTSFVMDIDNAKEDLGYEPEYTYIKYLEDYKKERELKRFDDLWLGRV